MPAPDRPTERGEARPGSLLLTDAEAAVVYRWTRDYPSRGPAIGGQYGAANATGLTRATLQRICNPRPDKRQPARLASLDILLKHVMADTATGFELRRVASDEMQRAMDHALAGTAFRARLDVPAGCIVSVVPI